jgi:hypothetical protein
METWRSVAIGACILLLIPSLALFGWALARPYHDVQQGYAFGAGLAGTLIFGCAVVILVKKRRAR